MTRIDDAARVLDTVGLAAWFGGSLVGVVALANTADDAALEYEDAAWRRWSPVQTAAIAAHLAGSARLAATNKGRFSTQRGVPAAAVFKGVCTVGALGATWYASRLGRRAHEEASSGDAISDDERSSTRRRLRTAQVAVPVLTGAMLVADARLGEQQRPAQVIKGTVERLVPDALQSIPEALHSVPEVLHSVPEVLQSVPEVLQSVPEVLHSVPGALRSLPEALDSVPIADTSRELAAKVGELGRAASSSSIAEPIRHAVRH